MVANERWEWKRKVAKNNGNHENDWKCQLWTTLMHTSSNVLVLKNIYKLSTGLPPACEYIVLSPPGSVKERKKEKKIPGAQDRWYSWSAGGIKNKKISWDLRHVYVSSPCFCCCWYCQLHLHWCPDTSLCTSLLKTQAQTSAFHQESHCSETYVFISFFIYLSFNFLVTRPFYLFIISNNFVLVLMYQPTSAGVPILFS